MSTRARIGIVRPDGSVLSIYTHSDGYISHHGPILLEHYDTAQKVLALMKMGDASQLNETLDDCVFYARDNGETNVGARTNKNQDLYFRHASWCNTEFVYLFLPDTATWLVAEIGWSTRNTAPLWQDLTKATITKRLTS